MTKESRATGDNLRSRLIKKKQWVEEINSIDRGASGKEVLMDSERGNFLVTVWTLKKGQQLEWRSSFAHNRLKEKDRKKEMGGGIIMNHHPHHMKPHSS